jgi:hypothetical protein
MNTFNNVCRRGRMALAVEIIPAELYRLDLEYDC